MNYLYVKYKFLLSTLIFIFGLFCISSFILIMNCNIDLLQKNIFNINCLLLINIIISVCNIKDYINVNNIIHIHRKYKINFYILSFPICLSNLYFMPFVYISINIVVFNFNILMVDNNTTLNILLYIHMIIYAFLILFNTMECIVFIYWHFVNYINGFDMFVSYENESLLINITPVPSYTINVVGTEIV